MKVLCIVRKKTFGAIWFVKFLMKGMVSNTKKEYARDGYIEPEWSIKEREALAQKWRNSNSKMSIFDYILSHASKRFIKEFNRAQKIFEKAAE